MKSYRLLTLLMALFPLFAVFQASAQTAGDAKDKGEEQSTPPAIVSPPKALTVEIHGFAEMDMMMDDTGGMPEIVGNGAVLAPGTLAGNNGRTQFELRNSRLSFLAAAPDIDGWKTRGYVEGDFLGFDPAAGNSLGTTRQLTSEASYYTAPTFRIRHAYMAAETEGWQILAGQTWTIFAFNPDYVLSSVSLAPVMGTVYKRTPQIRVRKSLGEGDVKVQVLAAATRPEQRDSLTPDFAGGIRVMLDSWKGRFAPATGAVMSMPFSLALSGTLRDYAYPTPPSLVYNTMAGQALAANAMVPLLPYDGKDGISLVVAGEYTVGSGYGDELPNWSGGLPNFVNAVAATNPYNGPGAPNLDAGIAGMDASGKFQLVQLQTWNGQLQFYFPASWNTFLTMGYGELFSPNIALMPSGAYNDDYVLFANVMHDFTANIRLAAEYDRFDTHYMAGAGSDAIDHRVQVSTWFRF